jgi:hypothetical protein
MALSGRIPLPKPIRSTLVTSICILIVAVLVWFICFKLLHTHFAVDIHVDNGKGS